MIILKRYLLNLLFLIALVSCSTNGKREVVASENKSMTDSVFTVQIISNTTGGYGYEIFERGTKIISQPHLPGVPGDKGFKIKEDAEKVASLVIAKIKLNQTPPSVSRKELDSLGITIF